MSSNGKSVSPGNQSAQGEKAKTIEPNLKAMRLANKLIKKPKHTNAALSFDCSNSAVHRFQKDASLSASLSSALTN